MREEQEWLVVFWLAERGDSPVEEFLDRLHEKTQRRFRWSIDQLRVRNVQAREPLVRHLEGKIWELREESQTNIYRVLYAFISGRRILLLHGFQKKTEQTPRREIELAQKRLRDYLSPGGGQEDDN